MAEKKKVHYPLLWLVTQPDGNHYILAGTSSSVPYRCQQEDENTHQLYDVWNLEDCMFIYPVIKDNHPIYLRRHSWNDEPIQVVSSFFPANDSVVTCKFYSSMSQCWKHNFSKSHLACHNCIGSSLDKQKVCHSSVSPILPNSIFFEDLSSEI